jgi:hypothetical protein
MQTQQEISASVSLAQDGRLHCAQLKQCKLTPLNAQRAGLRPDPVLCLTCINRIAERDNWLSDALKVMGNAPEGLNCDLCGGKRVGIPKRGKRDVVAASSLPFVRVLSYVRVRGKYHSIGSTLVLQLECGHQIRRAACFGVPNRAHCANCGPEVRRQQEVSCQKR